LVAHLLSVQIKTKTTKNKPVRTLYKLEAPSIWDLGELINTMIAEIFYPNELKNIVQDLRVDDDLNEDALKTLNEQNNSMFIILLMLTALVFLGEGVLTGIVFTILAFLIFSVYYIWMIRRNYFRKMGVFIFGEERQCVVSQIHYLGRFLSRAVVTVKDIENNKVFKLMPGSIWGNKYYYPPKVQDVISYYYTQNKNYGAMPSTYEVKKHFCLLKSKV